MERKLCAAAHCERTENELLNGEAKGFQHCIINLWRERVERVMNDSRKDGRAEMRQQKFTANSESRMVKPEKMGLNVGIIRRKDGRLVCREITRVGFGINW